MLAPYAAAAVRDEKDFRKFFVFERNTRSFESVSSILKKKAADTAQRYEKLMEEKPSMKSKIQPFMKRLQMIADKGSPGLRTAPYFIVVAELKGIPPAELQSMAHVLENMWLKATAIGLGFQLVSTTSQMAEDEEFIKLLGLPVKKFAVNGCAVGYPTLVPPATPRPDTHKATRWMD